MKFCRISITSSNGWLYANLVLNRKQIKKSELNWIFFLQLNHNRRAIENFKILIGEQTLGTVDSNVQNKIYQRMSIRHSCNIYKFLKIL